MRINNSYKVTTIKSLLLSLLLSLVPSNLTAQSKPAAIGNPPMLSPHARPIVLNKKNVFVANTPADSVDVISIRTKKVIARILVGIDPVSLALRPDGKELWVSNHISDTISVIDTDSRSKTYLRVIATVQDLDFKTKTTNFDEPVGVAFASNEKAYVALSTENKIAVINVKTRKVTKRLNLVSQEPRAIVVRNNKLYVIPFESNNKSQLSGGKPEDIGVDPLVTYDGAKAVIGPNVLSLGHKEDIIKHPKYPDK